jgi:hypothetical protein
LDTFRKIIEKTRTIKPREDNGRAYRDAKESETSSAMEERGQKLLEQVAVEYRHECFGHQSPPQSLLLLLLLRHPFIPPCPLFPTTHSAFKAHITIPTYATTSRELVVVGEVQLRVHLIFATNNRCRR